MRHVTRNFSHILKLSFQIIGIIHRHANSRAHTLWRCVLFADSTSFHIYIPCLTLRRSPKWEEEKMFHPIPLQLPCPHFLPYSPFPSGFSYHRRTDRPTDFTVAYSVAQLRCGDTNKLTYYVLRNNTSYSRRPDLLRSLIGWMKCFLVIIFTLG
jgi:hypothetical protein